MTAHDLDHLRTFVTVTRAGSLTEAAALLGISQPTVSAHIQSLEAAFGFALLIRGRNGTTMTPKGAELAQAASAHIDALDDLASSVTASDGAMPLHLGGPAELLSERLLPHLGELIDRSGSPLNMTFGLADELLESLRAGSLDIVVSAIRPRLRGITAVPFFDEEFLLVANPERAARLPSDPGPNDWAGIPVIAYAQNLPIIRRYWQSVFARGPEELRVEAVVPDLRGIRTAVLAGAGMSVLPSYLVARDLAAGTLVELDKPEVAPLNTVYLAVRAGEDAANRRLRPLIDALIQAVTSTE